MNDNMKEDVLRVLLSEDEIRERCGSWAARSRRITKTAT